MTITNEQAFNLLDQCSAVIVDDTVVIFPSLHHEEAGSEDNPDGIFLLVSYDQDGEVYELEYAVKDNTTVEVVARNTIRLTDTEGGEVDLTLLTTMNIPAFLQGCYDA